MKYEIDGKWYEAPKGYVMESMFFNPRRAEAKYLVQAGDMLLVKTRVGAAWVKVEEGSDAVGEDFKDLIDMDETIQLIAIPQRYEFEDTSLYNMHGYFGWSCLGMGFGQMSFKLNEETGKVEFDTEMMGRETTRKVLHDLVDFMVDNGVSDDWERKEQASVD
jgi:hypothetical protein